MEILDEWPEALTPEPRPAYPWNEWLDGRPRRLTHGIDFLVSAHSLATAARVTGLRRGIKVRASVRGNTVFVQAIPGEVAR